MTIEGIGLPGTAYVLEATPTLVPIVIWTPIGTNRANPNGSFQLTDPEPPTYLQRFYRIVEY